MTKARILADYVATGVTAAEFDFLDVTSGTADATTFLRGDKTWQVVDTEGTGIKSTGESGATKFLREDGDGTSSWQAAGHPSIVDGGNATAITINSSEQVGIGVTPTEVLDVRSTGAITHIVDETSPAADTGAFLQLGGMVQRASGGDNPYRFAGIKGARQTSSNDHYAGYLSFYTTAAGAQWNERMRLSSDGNVGIGTVSPSALLEVEKDQNAQTIVAVDNNTSGTGAIAGFQADADAASGRLRVYSSGYSTASFNIADSVGLQAFSASGGLSLVSDHATADISFWTNSTQKMTIDGASGNVGVGGSTSPQDELHVGTGYFRISSAQSTSFYTRSNYIGWDGYFGADASDGYTQTIHNTNTGTNGNFFRWRSDLNGTITETMRITKDGKIGIGEASPTTALHITTASQGTLPALNSDADDLMIENSTPGITLMGATNGGGLLAFGDTDDADVGRIFYYHIDNTMKFYTAGTNRMTIDSAGKVQPHGDMHVSGKLSSWTGIHADAQVMFYTGDATDNGLRINCGSGSYTGTALEVQIARTNSESGYELFKCISSHDSGPDTRFSVRGDGLTYINGSLGINTSASNPLDVSGVIRGNATGHQYKLGDCSWYGAVTAGNNTQAFAIPGGKKVGWMSSLGTENNRNSGFRMYGYLWNSNNGMSMSERFNMTQGNGYGNGWIDVSGSNIRYRAHSSWHNNAYVKMNSIMGD